MQRRRALPEHLHIHRQKVRCVVLISFSFCSAPACGVFAAAPGVWRVTPPAAAVFKEFKLIVGAAAWPVYHPFKRVSKRALSSCVGHRVALLRSLWDAQDSPCLRSAPAWNASVGWHIPTLALRLFRQVTGCECGWGGGGRFAGPHTCRRLLCLSQTWPALEQTPRLIRIAVFSQRLTRDDKAGAHAGTSLDQDHMKSKGQSGLEVVGVQEKKREGEPEGGNIWGVICISFEKRAHRKHLERQSAESLFCPRKRAQRLFYTIISWVHVKVRVKVNGLVKAPCSRQQNYLRAV